MASIDPKAFDGIPLQIVAIPLKGPSGEQGDPGKAGVPGKSNYQLWLEAGNTGSIEDFLLTTKGEKGDTGAGLINRGLWTIGTYQPGEFVGSVKSGTDTTRVVWALVGNEEYVSTLPPYLEPTKWMMLDIKAGFEDAPADGKQYVRKDNGWTEVSIGEPDRVLTYTGTESINPYTKYAEWEAEYGYSPAGGSDWGTGLNADDIAGIFASGTKTGLDTSATCISSEGQIGWDYGANPSGGSVQVTIPGVSRAYWVPGPRPWMLQSFHPVGIDCEGREMIGRSIRGVGMIFRGTVGTRGGTDGVRFAIRFLGGSWELYLQSINVPVNHEVFKVSGSDSVPTFTRVAPLRAMANNTFLQAKWAPAE